MEITFEVTEREARLIHTFLRRSYFVKDAVTWKYKYIDIDILIDYMEFDI